MRAHARPPATSIDRGGSSACCRGLWGEVQAQGLIGQLPDLWGELLNTVQTDLTLNDVLYLAGLGAQIDRARIKNSFLDGQNAHRFTSEEGASVFYFSRRRNLADVEIGLRAAESQSGGAARGGGGSSEWHGQCRLGRRRHRSIELGRLRRLALRPGRYHRLRGYGHLRSALDAQRLAPV